MSKPVSLETDLAAFARTVRRGPQCVTCRAAADPHQGPLVAAALEGVKAGRVTAAVASKWLQSKGLTLSEYGFSRHIRQNHDAR